MMTVQKRCAVGMTEGFVYNGDWYYMTDEIRQEAPWAMMFADDIAICIGGKRIKSQ